MRWIRSSPIMLVIVVIGLVADRILLLALGKFPAATLGPGTVQAETAAPSS